jgi:hypothetical protein
MQQITVIEFTLLGILATCCVSSEADKLVPLILSSFLRLLPYFLR